MDELAKKMAELAEQYGPHVVEATRAAARVEAVVEAVSALVSGVVLIVCGVAMLKGARWLRKKVPDEDYDGEILAVMAGVGFVVSVLLFIGAAATFFDPWVWATFYNPDLWIAKKVIGL